MSKAASKAAWDPEDPVYSRSSVVPAGGRAKAKAPVRVVDRDRVLSDLGNTGVAAALIGGFALELLDLEEKGLAVYLLSLIAVHGCTCAALISALCYRTVNMMAEEDAVAWAIKWNWVLQTPLMKFAMGTVAYVSAVMVRSYNDLAVDYPGLKWLGLGLGVGSVSMMLMSVVMLKCTGPKTVKAS